VFVNVFFQLFMVALLEDHPIGGMFTGPRLCSTLFCIPNIWCMCGGHFHAVGGDALGQRHHGHGPKLAWVLTKRE
jgi:hypothetical protein